MEFMADIKLTEKEVQALRAALATLIFRARTGEIGIIHGANRFVSTDLCLRKVDKDVLNEAVAKLGLKNGIPEV